jgi:LPS-assembly protein
VETRCQVGVQGPPRAAPASRLGRLLALLVLSPAVVTAQATRPQPKAPPRARPGPSQPAPAGEAEEIRIKADTQEQVDKSHRRASGFVDVVVGGTRVQCDQMDLFTEDRPDGTRAHRLVAAGNVVFLRGDERISGERLELDLATGKGVFTDAIGFVEPGVFVEAKTIERIDDETYRVKGASFTSCCQPNPRWGFKASSATLHLDDKVVGRNVVFKVKSVPALYTPLFVYPIREDQRATGFLFPHFGYSAVRGFNVGEGFFWAMGRSADQTFFVDYFSKFGWSLGHEFRYVADAASRGTFKSTLFDAGPASGLDEPGRARDYDLDWNAAQSLPAGFRASVTVRRFSDLSFQQRVQYSLDRASTRSRRASGQVQRRAAGFNFQLQADSTETLFSQGDGSTLSRINRRLPALKVTRFAERLGASPLAFGLDARAESLERGDQDRVDRYGRYHLAPELALPLQTSFLQVSPSARYVLTAYGKSLAEDVQGELVANGPSLTRCFFETNLELRGPSFSRIFSSPGGWYSDRFKHVIGPELTYTYRTAVEDFEAIPKFDGEDQYLGTHQIRYGLVQRFLAKRRPAANPQGKAVPYEFLTWSLTQTYYFNVREGQNEFDPNYSSAVFGPGGVPDRNSPIQSNLRLRPSRDQSLNFRLEYDVNYRQFRRLDLGAALDTRRFGLTGNWSYARRLAVDPADRETVLNTLRGTSRLTLVPDHLTLEATADYDAVQKRVYRGSGRVRFDVQCVGLIAEMLQYNYNQLQPDRVFRFSIELANIGSFGSFDAEDRFGQLGGRR